MTLCLAEKFRYFVFIMLYYTLDCFVDVVFVGHTTFICPFHIVCCMKALKWNVFTDASARHLVVGQGEPLCEP